MKYISVAETAKKWNISERSVRNYCAQGRVPDAFLTGKTWNIPESEIAAYFIRYFTGRESEKVFWRNLS